MHFRKHILAAAFFAAQMTLAGLSSAQSGALPAEKKQGEVSYLSGGIGLDESEAIKRIAAQYPLELVFASGTASPGEYLADVHVTIKDRQGNAVLDTTSSGPFLLAKLSAGSYTIDAQARGQTQTRVVQIEPQRHTRVVFTWQK